MASTRLILVNEQASPPELLENCPTFDNISVPIDFQIADVRNPGEGSGSHSYTIKIPGSPEVDKFFEDVYDVNVALQKFNPNLKVKAFYYVDEIENFSGHLQILDIVCDEANEVHYFECNIIGEVSTLNTKIRTKYMTDLDMSAYNHNLTFANITASWAAAVGTGIKYPLIDWGTNNSNLTSTSPTDFRGCFHTRELLLKIFNNAGYTWTSNFLDSDFFKRNLTLPSGPSKIPQATLDNNKFLAVSNGTQVDFSTSPSYNPTVSGLVPFGSQIINKVEFPNETYDAGNIFNNNPTFFNFTVPVTNYYNVSANIGLKFTILRNLADVSASMTSITASGVHLIFFNQTNNTVDAIYDLDVNGGTFGSSTQYNASIQLNNVKLAGGAIYYIGVRIANMPLFYSSSAAGATWVLKTNVVSGSYFSADFASNNVYENATVVANDLLPQDYKQTDFISDLVKEFNLYITVDKTNPTNLIIEDRPNFFFTTARDWSAKHDRGSDVTVKPMGELDFIKLKFKHAEDGDFYNKLYQDEFKEPYGSHLVDVTNDFITNEKTIQLGIAATPYAVNQATGVVLPQIKKNENNVIGPVKPKPRRLYWSGSLAMPVGVSWKFTYNDNSNFVWYNVMPHAGHTNNPWAPTLDLSWNVPDKVYFYYPNQTWTTNGLYNKYYSQYINQITDKNSKIIKTRFYLTPNDIAIFDFRFPVFAVFGDQQGYYIVNKIEQYNPLISDTTAVELLKLTDYAVFTPTEENTGGGGGNNNGNNALFKENTTKGPNNFNNGESSMIYGGSGNFIANSGVSVTLLNSENASVVGVSNFLGVGLDNSSTPESDTVNLYDSLKVGSGGVRTFKQRSTTVYSDFTIDGTYTVYYINTNYFGLGITCTWDAQTYSGLTITFKMIDNGGGDLTIANGGSPPGQVELAASPYSTALAIGESITLHSDGIDLYILSNYNPNEGAGGSGSGTGEIIDMGDRLTGSDFTDMGNRI